MVVLALLFDQIGNVLVHDLASNSEGFTEFLEGVAVVHRDNVGLTVARLEVDAVGFPVGKQHADSLSNEEHRGRLFCLEHQMRQLLEVFGVVIVLRCQQQRHLPQVRVQLPGQILDELARVFVILEPTELEQLVHFTLGFVSTECLVTEQ